MEKIEPAFPGVFWDSAEVPGEVWQKNIEILEQNRLSDSGYAFRQGELKVVQGALSENKERVVEGVGAILDALSIAQVSPGALADAAWLSCFLDFGGDPLEWVRKATEKLPDKPAVWRARAFVESRHGTREEGLVSMGEAFRLSGKVSDRDALKKLEAGGSLSPFAGFLMADPDFGNLHHPPKKRPDFLTFQLFLVKELLESGGEIRELLFEGAILAFFAHKLDWARDWLYKFIKSESSHPDALAFLGWVEEKSGHLEKAVGHYRQALVEEPNHPLACTNLANIQLQLGVVFKANHLLEMALKAAPEYPEALCLSGKSASLLGQSDKAVDRLKKAVSLDPEIPDYHLEYCVGLLRTGNIEKLQAEWAYHKKYIPSFTDLGGLRRLFNLALAGAKDPLQDLETAQHLIKNGFYSAARFFILRAWKRSYKVEGGKAKQFYYHGGLAAAQCGEQSVALEAYQKLEALDAQGGTATVCVAMALSDLGRHGEASEKITQCNLSDPNYKLIQADILWKGDLAEEALGLYLEIAEILEPPLSAFLNGISCAMQCDNADAVRKLIKLGKQKFPLSTRMKGVGASAALLIDDVRDVLRELEDFLIKEKQFTVPSPVADAKPAEENINAPFYALGCGYLRAGEDEKLNTMLDWLPDHLPRGLAEWEVLRAEGFRRKGRDQEALQALSPSNPHPAASITRVLCYRELKDSAAAKTVLGKLPRDRAGFKFAFHPEGDTYTLTWKLLKEYGEETPVLSAGS